MTATRMTGQVPVSRSNRDDGQVIRVLHVEAGTYFGGSHKALATYLKSSRDPNLQHHVLLVHAVPELEAALSGVCPVTTLAKRAGPVFQPPSGKAAILKFWAAQTHGICRFLLSGRFDLVHVNNTFTFQPYTLLASRLVGIPAVAHARNPVPNTMFARLLAKFPRLIVAVNAGLNRSIEQWCAADVQVCYDDIDFGSPDVDGASQMRDALLGSGTVLIGSVGRLEHQKGYDVFLEAAKGIAAEHQGVRFAIAGEGPMSAALERRIDELDLQEKFHLCGFRSDIATFLQSLDVFVCSSRYEGGPMTVAEALMMSKPVISTPVGFVPELTCEGGCVDLVPIGDVAALSAAIKRAIVAKEAPVAFAETVSRVEQLFNPLLAAGKLDALFRTAGQGEQNQRC